LSYTTYTRSNSSVRSLSDLLAPHIHTDRHTHTGTHINTHTCTNDVLPFIQQVTQTVSLMMFSYTAQDLGWNDLLMEACDWESSNIDLDE